MIQSESKTDGMAAKTSPLLKMDLIGGIGNDERLMSYMKSAIES